MLVLAYSYLIVDGSGRRSYRAPNFLSDRFRGLHFCVSNLTVRSVPQACRLVGMCFITRPDCQLTCPVYVKGLEIGDGINNILATCYRDLGFRQSYSSSILCCIGYVICTLGDCLACKCSRPLSIGNGQRMTAPVRPFDSTPNFVHQEFHDG